MMKDVEKGRIDRVVVYSFSRYARSTSHLLQALNTFKEKANGVTSEILDEEITEELEEKVTPKKQPEEVEVPPVPIPVVRF